MTTAAFTIAKDEREMLPRWIAYYGQHVNPRDMYVLDHSSTDPAVLRTLLDFANAGGNVRRVFSDTVFDHDWLLSTVHDFQRDLLTTHAFVLYTDTDEIVIPKHGTLREFLANVTAPSYRCIGYEVIEDTIARHGMYDKTLLANHPLTWNYGYHDATPQIEPSGELFLYHLHRMDYAEAWAKNQRWARHQWDQTALASGFSIQNQHTDEAKFREWFYDTKGAEREPLHDRLITNMEWSQTCEPSRN